MSVEDDLAKWSRVISYDRRGHTGSEDSPQPGSATATTRTISPRSSRRTVWRRRTLFANSFGASIALSLTARRPELVRSVSPRAAADGACG